MTVTVPGSLDEALSALAAYPDASVLAGGTDFMVEVNEGFRRPEIVVCVTRLAELRGVRTEGDECVVGAATTYAELERPEAAALMPALAQAARTVGSPQIRNAATLGGNLATGSPAGDGLPVLVAVGATVELANRAGTRRVGIRDFLVGPKRTALEPGELIVAVRMPRVKGPQEFLKVGVRNAMVISVASLALAVDLDAHTLGVGLGSVGPTALAAPDACEWIAPRLAWHDDRVVLRQPDDLAHFALMVGDAVRAIDDHRGTADYRRHAVRVMAARALRRATT